MESFGRILMFAIPGFVSLILIEYIWGLYKGQVNYRPIDTLSSLSSGITNIIKDVLGITFVIVSYEWLVNKISLVPIPEPNIWWYVGGFIAIDFASYWGHRLSHRVNVFWNKHIVHHSSEEFNLACALRQSISSFSNVYVFFLLPAALFGVPGEVIAILSPFHLFAQYWYHTQYIGRLGWLEYVIVTPSQHRVHHAINPEYLDKNYGAIFCVWDRWFGSFQEELDDVPAVYGVKRQVKTWNPVIINFQHLALLFRDTFNAKSWYDKARLWFMPTGWRPADAAEKFPIEIIDDPYSQVKYDTKASRGMVFWLWVQMTFNLSLMFYLFSDLSGIGFPNVIYFGLFLILSVFSYSMLMDRSIHAWWVELFKSALGFAIVTYTGDWFGIQSVFSWAPAVISSYFVFSFLMTLWVLRFEGIWGGEKASMQSQGALSS
jgi:sterol desaturase/sphingolipid hydroxylase (fatty acid hydroxylase superfamily)